MTDQNSGADWKFKATSSGGFKIRDNAFGLDVITVEANSSANALTIDAEGNVAMGTPLANGYGLNVMNYASGKASVHGYSDQAGTVYSSGMLGVLDPFFLGVPLSVTNVGVLGIKYPNGSTGAAVYGWNSDATNTSNYGGLFFTNGAASGTNFGVYSVAKSAAVNYAGRYFGRMEIDGHSGSSDGADYTATVLKVDVNHNAQVDTRAVDAVSKPVDGYGYGVYGTGGYVGVFGSAQAGAYNNFAYGVYGNATGTAGVRIGVYGNASGGETNWAGYFNGHTYISSDLRIATTTQAAGFALSVNGKIACEEVLVQDLNNWPDYVFDDGYRLRSLAEVESVIQRDRHLPGMPSASEIEESGLSLGEMQKKLLEKVEELTLYAIRQEKTIEKMQMEIEYLKVENQKLRRNVR
jgi:hypothetical protein